MSREFIQVPPVFHANIVWRLGLPYGEPKCSANSSLNNEYLMLSCSWDGGFPRALLWWASSSGEIQGTSELDTNTLILHSSANYSGKTFVCHSKHPLVKEGKQCSLKLGKICFLLYVPHCSETVYPYIIPEHCSTYDCQNFVTYSLLIFYNRSSDSSFSCKPNSRFIKNFLILIYIFFFNFYGRKLQCQHLVTVS